MPNEHALTRAIRAEIKKRKAAGEPVWARKLHGSAYQRDLPDWLICYAGMFVVIETKVGGNTLTPGQRKILLDIAQAGGRCSVRTSLASVREALDELRAEAERRRARDENDAEIRAMMGGR